MGKMMNRIIYILSPYIGLLLQYSFMGQLLPRKKPWWYVPLTAIPIMLAPITKQIFGPVSSAGQAAGIVCTLICCLWMPTRLFRAPAWKSMGLGIFFYATQFLMDAFAYFLCRPVFGDVTQLYTTQQIALYVAVTWSVYALICSGYLLVGRAVSMRRFRPFYLLLLIFPLSQGALLYCSIYGTLNWIFLLAILLGLGAQVGLLIDIVSYEEKIALREQLQDTQHQMALEQAQYEYAQQRREELARIRHDFNNQLMAIGALIRSGDRDDAEKLLQDLSRSVAATREEPFCTIPVVNAVLTEKAAVCRQKGIGLQCELEIPADLPVKLMHYSSIFNNLMDNAIRGAEGAAADEPTIRLSARMQGDYLVIKAVNPCAQEPEPPRQGHGRGFSILRSIAEQYNGDFQANREAGVFTAILSLLVEN